MADNVSLSCIKEGGSSSARNSGSFRTKNEKVKYYIILFLVIGLGILASAGLALYNNPVPVDSPSFKPIVIRRLVSIVAMGIAATCHSIATISFQTVTANKVITPSLLGFEAVYSFIHTLTIFSFGISGLQDFKGMGPFVFQILIMVLVCMLLYGTLLTGRKANLHFMLLIGIVLASGLRSFSTFLRRFLSPSEFDILQARLFASVNHADADYFPIAVPLIIIAALVMFSRSNKLNVLALGRDVSTNLGLKHNRELLGVLVIVSILMAVSTALVGPLTFFGFLTAALTYQIVPSYDHKYIFAMALALGFLILTLSYFVMNHIFYAQGVVSIIIELVGGLVFLTYILRKGSL